MTTIYAEPLVDIHAGGKTIDPLDCRTWPEEARRNHRLRRALHELMASGNYTLEVGDRPDGTVGIRLNPAESVTVEARVFLTQYREELLTHHYWMQEVDQEYRTGDTPAWNR